MSQALLDEIVRRVVEVAKPNRIILLGSSARGTMGPDNDLDLLVIKTNVPHRRRLAQQIYLSLFGIRVPVDDVVTPDDILAYGDKAGTIIGPALREGGNSMPPKRRDWTEPLRVNCRNIGRRL